MELFDVGDGGECLPLSLYVLTVRLIARGLTIDEAAAATRIPEPKLRAFYNRCLLAGWNRRQEFELEERRQEKAGEDYLRTRPGEVQRFKYIDLKMVRQPIKGGVDVADKLGLDPDEFRRWFMDHWDSLRERTEDEKRLEGYQPYF